MYSRSFLCEEAKIKQRTSLKKGLCEIGEEAIWESRFTSFLLNFSIHFNQLVVILFEIYKSNSKYLQMYVDFFFQIEIHIINYYQIWDFC